MWYADSLILRKESQVERISGEIVLTKSRTKIALFNAICLLIFFIWTNSRLQRRIDDVFHIILTPKARLIWSCKSQQRLHTPRIMASTVLITTRLLARFCGLEWSVPSPTVFQRTASPPRGSGVPPEFVGYICSRPKRFF